MNKGGGDEKITSGDATTGVPGISDNRNYYKIFTRLVDDILGYRYNLGSTLHNFPGNVIGPICKNMRDSDFCKKIRDKIDHINGM